MNTKIIVAIIAIIVVGGGAVFFTQNKKTSPQAEVASNSQIAQPEEQVTSQSASVISLLESGKNQQCTFSTVAEGSETAGMVYLANGKMRGDFTVKTSEMAVLSHTIYDGTTSYVWTDTGGDGIKMKVDLATIAEAQQSNRSLDLKQNLQFDCKNWNVDESMFVAPSNVTFSDIAVTTSGTGAETSIDVDPKELQKAVCNNIPEPQKSECLAGIQ